ncbi:hypothetical protein [Massilia rubra]|uniref:Uncharacterized protein n=1 Tax=Massilia rubra TaxID=2607910 RepID=A0ABX0LTF1_9BURK|nr:hypothetical protein [Massilia rubra]NHZ35640.1 hypothetical protein [Massilia rubra]
MSDQSSASHFSVLQQIGLITRNQVQRALAHPQAGELADYPQLADHLVWLVLRDILEEDDLEQKYQRFLSTYSGEDREQHRRAIDIALLKIHGVREGLNRDWFDTLVAESIITDEERTRALEALPGDEMLASAAAAFVWMVYAQVITHERLDEIRAVTGGSAGRAAILAEVQEMFGKISSAARSTVIRGIFPGPLWLWIGAALAFVGYIVWSLVRPDPIPECTDREVTSTVASIMFRLNVDEGVNAYLRPGGERAPRASVDGIREVGFDEVGRVRGCIGTLTMGPIERPYAFTVARGKEGGYSVTGADPDIVQARFGKGAGPASADSKGAPVGRANIDKAFRAAADKFKADAGDERLAKMMESVAGTPRLGARTSQGAPERTRDIPEIEPLAPCREITPGGTYSCRLLVERKDPMLALFGGASASVFEADFSFVRQGDGWAMADSFTQEYQGAIDAARKKALAAARADAPK